MGKEILFREANLDTFPEVIAHSAEHTHVSVGDLHGNALKLIYTLIEEGILEVTREEYETLRDIYYKPTDSLTAIDLDAFRTIINSATVNSTRSLTLIGDELADRGNNDYFTLFVLKKLHDVNLDVDIMVSNHSAEFIRDYENPHFTGAHQLFGNQGQSLTNMQRLIARGLVDEEDVRRIVDDCYKPMVKAIGYTVSPEGELTLFSHAPIGLETIEALAAKFNIPYHEDSPKALIKTIDAINDHLRTLLGEKSLAQLIDAEGHSDPRHPIPLTSPLMRLVWNRALGDELRTESHGGFKVHFVHGHIGDGAILQHGAIPLPSHRNLDGWFGKGRELSQTGYLRDAYGSLDVRHFTQQSSELTAKQLAAGLADTRTKALLEETGATRLLYPKIRETLLDIQAQIDKQEQPANYEEFYKKTEALLNELDEKSEAYHRGEITAEIYEKGLHDLDSRVYKHQEKIMQHLAFEHALALLAIKNEELQEKANNDPNYKKAAIASNDLLTVLSREHQSFLKNAITPETFKKRCDTAIESATTELEKHRGLWYKMSPIIRGLLGIVALLAAAIPAVAVAVFAKHGYSGTFFSTPETDSKEKIDILKQAYEELIKPEESTGEEECRPELP